MRLLFVFSIVCLCASSLLGCGEIETQIRTSYVLDTDDTDGPYQVMAVVASGDQPTGVYLIYSTDKWNDNKKMVVVEMNNVSQDVYQAKIPGQPAGTTVSYYILVQTPSGKNPTDPADMLTDPADASKIIPKQKDFTYQFRVLK